jgi:hypothetical protein
MGNVHDIHAGRIVVASDIHGNWEDYQRVRKRFEQLRKANRAEVLALGGDIIHSERGEDSSVRILDDLIDNPDDCVLSMMGNHELAHIYHMSVSAGNHSITDAFEEQVAGKRERYAGFMKKMPYAIRTRGGVLINHSGANAAMSKKCGFTNLNAFVDGFNLIDLLDHDAVIEELKTFVRCAYRQEGKTLPEGFFDGYTPEIGQIFGDSGIGKYLWDVFFNGNEHEYGNNYRSILNSFLEVMSTGRDPLQFLVSGHLPVPAEGYQTLYGTQLRASLTHCADKSRRKLPLIDAARNYDTIEQIVNSMVPLEE